MLENEKETEVEDMMEVADGLNKIKECFELVMMLTDVRTDCDQSPRVVEIALFTEFGRIWATFDVEYSSDGWRALYGVPLTDATEFSGGGWEAKAETDKITLWSD